MASDSLSGQTVLITGPTSGLGYAASRQLLLLKPKLLIFAVRNIDKGEATRKEFLADSEILAAHPTAAIKVLHLDLENYASVLSFVAALKTETNLLHMAILNAAAVPGAFVLAQDGHESGVQNMFLSNALLALELLPLMQATSKFTGVPSKLTWVGSTMQRLNSFSSKPVRPDETVLAHMDNPANYSNIRRYGDAKLLVSMWINNLSKRVASSSLTINTVDPGPIKTELGRSAPLHLRIVAGIVRVAFSAKPPDYGAKIYIHAVMSGEKSHGKLIFGKDQPPNDDTPLADIIGTEEGKRLTAMLWEETKKEFIALDASLAGTYDELDNPK
jgi:NAD(P)-dependent dehydrogenase (short-subunit alcohol dehydrogenase family)